jgi:antitoxin (DNA-binding transcriptional repressor) of toxin-antitoxin stability system
METVTIRELRQSWPAVQKRLAAVGELTVTRDGQAVAMLATPRAAPSQRLGKRFDPAGHARLIRKLWGPAGPSFGTEQALQEERAERRLGPGSP